MLKIGRKTRIPPRAIFELTPLEQRVLLSAFTNYSYDFEGGSPNTSGWSNTTIATANAVGSRPSTLFGAP